MDHFRWVLIIIGIFLFACIYFFYLLKNRFPQRSDKASQSETNDKNEVSDDEIIRLILVSRTGGIQGADLIHAMRKLRLTFGNMNIFHRLVEGGQQPLFSVINMVEPGSFDIEKLPTEKIPGLVLFLKLPRAFSALHALDEMWHTARALAEELNADILDRDRQPFSSQKQQKMRDEVLEHMRQIELQKKLGEYH